MFKVVTEPLAWIDVEVRTLAAGTAEQANQFATDLIPMQVAILPRSEFKRALDEGTETFEAFMVRVIKDWRVGDEKNAWKFGREKLRQLDDVLPQLGQDFVNAYAKALRGALEQREGNSDASPDAGQPDEADRATPTSSRSKPARSASRLTPRSSTGTRKPKT